MLSGEMILDMTPQSAAVVLDGMSPSGKTEHSLMECSGKAGSVEAGWDGKI